MKTKFVILAALCAVAFSANAQTEKGKSLISGSFGYSSGKTENTTTLISTSSFGSEKTSSFQIMPRFGYFVSKNLAVGLGIGFAKEKTTTSNYNNMYYPGTYTVFQESKQQNFNIGPFVRYYIDVVEKFKFFGQLNTQVGFGKVDQTLQYGTFTGSSYFINTNESGYKTTIYSAAINPGFAFFPSKRWAIEFSFPLLSYTKIKPKKQVNSAYPSLEAFSFATDSFNPSIGFNFHF